MRLKHPGAVDFCDQTVKKGGREVEMNNISERVSTSYDIVGHPQQASKPVEEGRHYKVLAYTDWADSLIPTVIKWNHGEVDDFTDPEKSRQNQAKAKEHEEAETE